MMKIRSEATLFKNVLDCKRFPCTLGACIWILETLQNQVCEPESSIEKQFTLIIRFILRYTAQIIRKELEMNESSESVMGPIDVMRIFITDANLILRFFLE